MILHKVLSHLAEVAVTLRLNWEVLTDHETCAVGGVESPNIVCTRYFHFGKSEVIPDSQPPSYSAVPYISSLDLIFSLFGTEIVDSFQKNNDF